MCGSAAKTANGRKPVACCRLRFLSFSLGVSAWLQCSRLLRCKHTGEHSCVYSRKAALLCLWWVGEQRNGTMSANVRWEPSRAGSWGAGVGWVLEWWLHLCSAAPLGEGRAAEALLSHVKGFWALSFLFYLLSISASLFLVGSGPSHHDLLGGILESEIKARCLSPSYGK